MTFPPGDDLTKLSDRQRAFKNYKKAVEKSGKPFFPYGVYHDIIAAIVVVGIVMMLSVVWFSQANCGAWIDTSCPEAATPMEQEGEVARKGVPKDQQTTKPLLGPLYEEKADPGTTSYHPRPEWYFYFLFDLLRLITEPNLLFLGTIGIPTVALMLLIAWPFIDTKRERRPSRRPLAMVGMGVTAVVLLSLSWHGSQAGKEKSTLSEAQKAMPGYALIFDDPRGAGCFGCHSIAGRSGGSVGPALEDEAAANRGIQWQYEHLKKPTSKTPGSGMPPQTAYNDEELTNMAAFLETIGAEERAEQAEYTRPKVKLVK